MLIHLNFVIHAKRRETRLSSSYSVERFPILHQMGLHAMFCEILNIPLILKRKISVLFNKHGNF